MSADLLDLHGKRPDEALDAINRFLLQVEQRKLKRFRIMTGKGTGKLRDLVIGILKQGGYPWKYEKLANGKLNEGVLVVFME